MESSFIMLGVRGWDPRGVASQSDPEQKGGDTFVALASVSNMRR